MIFYKRDKNIFISKNQVVNENPQKVLLGIKNYFMKVPSSSSLKAVLNSS